MKQSRAILLLAATAVSAPAQTAAPSSDATPMSLMDCITAALKNNFDVRIERYNPEIARLNLAAAYAGYDPQFSFSGMHNYNNSGAYFRGGQVVVPTKERYNTFIPNLSGGTPWGMTYNLAADLSETHTVSGVNTNLLRFPDNSSGSVGLTLTQPLLKNFWIDSTRLQISLAKNQVKYNEQGLRQQVIATVTSVEIAYYELIFARGNVGVQEDALNLAKTQLAQDQQRVQIGTLAPLDVEQDQAQVAQSRANLIAAQSMLATDQNQLKNLITDSYAHWHDLNIEPTATLEAAPQTLDVQDSWSRGLAGRPELMQTKLNLESQGIQIKYFRNQLFPEVDLVGSFGLNGSGDQYHDSFNQINDGSRVFYSYGGRISLPLGNIAARNNLKAGKASERQMLLTFKQLEQSIMVEIDNAVKNARSAWESTVATREARVYAEAALNAEQKKYAAGKSTTFTVLQLQNNLTAARSNEIRALANYNQALAALAAAESSTLQRHNLDVQAP